MTSSAFSIVGKIREILLDNQFIYDISIKLFLNRFQVVQNLRKNPANTDEDRIQDTIFFPNFFYKILKYLNLYTYKTLITLIVCLFVCLRPCVRILDTEWLL